MHLYILLFEECDKQVLPSIDILWIISLVMYIPIQIKYRMIISIKNKKFKVCVLFVVFFSDILVAIQQC